MASNACQNFVVTRNTSLNTIWFYGRDEIVGLQVSPFTRYQIADLSILLITVTLLSQIRFVCANRILWNPITAAYHQYNIFSYHFTYSPPTLSPSPSPSMTITIYHQDHYHHYYHHVSYIIFCYLLHIHSGKTGNLFSLLLCNLWWVQIVG